MRRIAGWSGWLAGVLVSLLGCTPRDPNLPVIYPVTGTVTLDGRPVPGAFVNFIPTGSSPGWAAAARTDDQGRFTLQTNNLGAGAAAGDYKVTIAVGLDEGIEVAPPNAAEIAELAAKLPQQYTSEVETPLTAKVVEPGSVFHFQIPSLNSSFAPAPGVRR